MRATEQFIWGFYPIKYSKDDEQSTIISQYISYLFEIRHGKIFTVVSYTIFKLTTLNSRPSKEETTLHLLSSARGEENPVTADLPFGFAIPHINVANILLSTSARGQNFNRITKICRLTLWISSHRYMFAFVVFLFSLIVEVIVLNVRYSLIIAQTFASHKLAKLLSSLNEESKSYYERLDKSLHWAKMFIIYLIHVVVIIKIQHSFYVRFRCMHDPFFIMIITLCFCD